MGRPIGSRNQGFAERREQIAAAMTDKMRRAAGAKASLRELADAADISVATLRHYFTDREGAIRAAFEFFHRKEEPYLAEARTPTLGDLEGSVRSFLEHVVDGMRNQGLDEMLLNGLEAGVHHDQLGPSFITEVLEPMIQSLEARLEAHMEHGDMARANSRHAALFLLSPVLLALFHQDGLCGAQLRPLDLDAMVR
ncbi:MAG: hypothetical protein AAFQ82_15930, partial [Myxococcota bacterium]